jgi:hypothetical protein
MTRHFINKLREFMVISNNNNNGSTNMLKNLITSFWFGFFVVHMFSELNTFAKELCASIKFYLLATSILPQTIALSIHSTTHTEQLFFVEIHAVLSFYCLFPVCSQKLKQKEK